MPHFQLAESAAVDSISTYTSLATKIEKIRGESHHILFARLSHMDMPNVKGDREMQSFHLCQNICKYSEYLRIIQKITTLTKAHAPKDHQVDS